MPCSARYSHQECRRIYDFEEDKDLDGLGWKCHTWYERSRKHATHGSFSLKVEMYPPETYPGLGILDFRGSWKDVKMVRLDIFNPGAEPVFLTFRIDDRRDDPPYSDRVNMRVELHPGMNSLTLDFARLRTSGTGRLLHVAAVCAFMVFIVSPREPVTIFVDNIRLCK